MMIDDMMDLVVPFFGAGCIFGIFLLLVFFYFVGFSNVGVSLLFLCGLFFLLIFVMALINWRHFKNKFVEVEESE